MVMNSLNLNTFTSKDNPLFSPQSNIHYQLQGYQGTEKSVITPVNRRPTFRYATPSTSGKFQYIHHYARISPEEYHDSELHKFFSDDTVQIISNKITQHLDGVRSDGKRVVLHPDRIRDLMGRVYTTNKAGYADMVDHCISRAVDQIGNELGFIENNNNLSIWTSNYYGDPADYNLRAHPPIKINNKRAKGGFNMNF